MAQAQKPDFVFRRNGRVHLNWRERQFSRLLAAEVCASAVVMLDTPRSEVVWRVLATHSIHKFPLHFPSRASPCAIIFQLESTTCFKIKKKLRSADTINRHSRLLRGTYWEWPIIPSSNISQLIFVIETRCIFFWSNSRT